MFNLCLLLLQTVTSGAVGYFAGIIVQEMGYAVNVSSAVAGLSGFMGAQSLSFLWLVLHTRYYKT